MAKSTIYKKVWTPPSQSHVQNWFDRFEEADVYLIQPSSVVTQPEICSRSTTFLWKIGADSEQYSKKKEGIGAKKL